MTVTGTEFISGEQLIAELRASGVEVPPSTLRSWREKNLLPSAERGGSARHPASSIDQAKTAYALSLRKKRADFIGWHLWLQGFDVGEQYWKPVLESVGRETFKALRRIARLLRSDDEEILDRFDQRVIERASNNKFPKLVSANTQRMNDADKAAVIVMLAQAVSGTLECADEEADERKRLKDFQTAIGAASARSDKVTGQSLEFGPVLDQLIRSLAIAPEIKIDTSLFVGNRIRLLEEAKRDFVFGLEVATELHDAFEWIFGRNAFGLKAANWFRWKASIEMQASVLLLWLALKESDKIDTLDGVELSEIHDEARRVNLLSQELQQVVRSTPNLEKLITRKALKTALKDDNKFLKFLKRIRNEACM
ncbi:hypothetical protein [Henriciella marina]|uniref:hypothetical protein n=1 Tax=Henriciella marina TaxID=453851 RepID=UPI0003673A15|nr:hypothetical protein [Henriciella marina]